MRSGRLYARITMTAAAGLALVSPRAIIGHHASSGTPTIEAARPDSSAPLDRDWTEVDMNGSPLDPWWHGQGAGATRPLYFPANDICLGSLLFADPRCTSGKEKVTYDLANGAFSICNVVGHETHPIRGHANYGLATYNGWVFWGEHTDPILDNEYCIEVKPRDAARGLLAANNGTIHIEFDASETINHFDSAWWTDFREKVDDEDVTVGDVDAYHKRVTDLVDGREAIIIGLHGLDCQHECQAELHPVYAMAIHVKDDPNDDQWAIFARNWGNEGLCSRADHPVDLSKVTFRLPWRSGATGVAVVPGTRFCNNFQAAEKPELRYMPSEGVAFSLPLAGPDGKPRNSGELHLKWSGRAGAVTVASPAPVAPPAPRGTVTDEPERRFATRARAAREAAMTDIPQEVQEFRFGRSLDRYCSPEVAVIQSSLSAQFRVTAAPPVPSIGTPTLSLAAREAMEKWQMRNLKAKEPGR